MARPDLSASAFEPGSVPEALFMPLDKAAVTDHARALVAEVQRTVAVEIGDKGIRRTKNRWKVDVAVERLVGDLVGLSLASSSGGLVYRSWMASSFTGNEDGYSYRQATGVRDAFERLGWLEKVAGHFHCRDIERFAHGSYEQNNKAARYRATWKFRNLVHRYGIQSGLVHRHGIPSGEERQHFKVAQRQKVIELRLERGGDARLDMDASAIGKKPASRFVKFKPTERTWELSEEIRTINAFLGTAKLTGGQFYPLRRLFSIPSTLPLDEYGWDRHGRLYSAGLGSYQSLPSADRARMLINGQPVAEVDIRAAHLMLVYGLVGAGKPRRWLRRDPYVSPSYPRDVLKGAILAMLGKGSTLTRWPLGIHTRLKERGHDPKAAKIRDVCQAAMKLHPVLQAWFARSGSSMTLMFIEAEIILATMRWCVGQGIPAYPVHESLIVPASNAQTVAKRLRHVFMEQTTKHGKIAVLPDVRIKQGT